MAAATAGMATADEVKIYNIAELSGAGAATGVQWTMGLELAFEEINAAGGVLGSTLDLETLDSRTDAQTSRALVQRAIDDDTFVIFGTIYSASTIVNMKVAEQNGIPQFTGSAAPSIIEQGNPYIFRTAFGSQKIMPGIVQYMRDGLSVSKVGISWVNSEYGVGGHTQFLAAAEAAGIEVVADVVSEVGQADFASDVVKLKSSGAEAVMVFLHEEDAARFLVEYRRQGVTLPVLGGDTLSNTKTVELAGGAAEGVLTYVGTAPEAPIPEVQAFTEAFKQRFGLAPTYLALNSYIGAYALKHVVEEVGSFDRQGVADMMHGIRINVADEPGVLMDVGWDDKGEIYRQGFIVTIKDGQPIVMETVPYN